MEETKNGDLFDFSSTPLASTYKGFYVKVLDNIFTPEECASLIALAESESGGKWDTAAISTHRGDVIDTTYRNSERILRFDETTADMIYRRLLPYVQELVEITPKGEWEGIVGTPKRIKGKWKLVGINERLSFLRYTPGDFFKEHCDGLLELPDGRKSRVTLQIYLNKDGLSGGATRFIASKNRYVDIAPEVGRVLIFQQRGLYHSGEEVVKGVKYAMRSDFMFTQEI